MTTYCRLCAELKTGDDLSTTIHDAALKIEEKLIICCQWNNYRHTNPNLPDAVCYSCFEKLEKCWLFSETVAIAQAKLQEILQDTELVDIKYEINAEDDEFNPSEAEDIFVEPLKVAAIPISDDKPLHSTTTDSVDETKPRQLHECEICRKSFTTAYNLANHVRSHTGERPYPCSKCGKQFKSSSNVNQHLRQVHGKGKISNDDDEVPGAKAEKAPKPIDTSTQDPEKFPYVCKHCGRRFRLRCTLTEHVSVHSSERPYECWMCHRSFKRRKLLKVHMRIHIYYPAIECHICGKRFRRNIQRDNHIKERHNAPVPKRIKKPPPPPKAPVRKFTCELCGASFHQRGGLFTHMTVHSDHRPYKCSICGLGFKRKRTMQDHHKTHTHELEHKCNLCEKAFRKKISLHRHLEYHTGSIAKPFICDFCAKPFRLNANLVEHRRIHTGEKPFFCEHCASSFRTMSSFYSHLKKEHGISVLARKLEEQARATAIS